MNVFVFDWKHFVTHLVGQRRNVILFYQTNLLKWSTFVSDKYYFERAFRRKKANRNRHVLIERIQYDPISDNFKCTFRKIITI